MKTLVTGGAGFIGSHIVDALLAQGDEVIVVDTLIAGKRERVSAQATLLEVDIRNYDAMLAALRGVEVVYHLAALPRVQYSIDDPLETHDVNVNGTLTVLRAAKDAGVRRVVFTSSSSIYGTQDVLPFREDTSVPNPESPYALHKRIGEEYARVFSHVYGLETVSLRYFNVYGPRLDPEGPYALVVGKFLKQKKEGVPLTITGDGTQTRDFTHVTDVARANLLAAKATTVGHGEVINIGAGSPTSINELAAKIGGETTYIPARLEPKHTYASVERAHALLGWKPEVSFDDGMAELRTLFS